MNFLHTTLEANGIKPDGKPLTPASAKEIKLTGGK